ncbi:class I SAM-dependent methyltransferase [Nocardia inohanensis]|uniref:class I SAM-dependent methyltransferase n=1 Tax=Nocardia inohanensis TaxID=209246 RepID=UPI000A0279A2|nr:class I SAM-dependent methyltransferase [Nocardia inohanensis]
MSESEFRPENPDFEAVYRGEGPFDDAPAPWDIGAPQPSFVALEESGLVTGAVLDSGCGTGENALYLAGKGYDVTGVDLAPTAIQRAHDKAKQRGLSAAFAVADVFDLEAYRGRFDTVVDSGVAHLFHGEELARYAASLHGVCKPGALVHVLALSDRAAKHFEQLIAEMMEKFGATDIEVPADRGNVAPSLRADELRAGFADGWTLEALDETDFRIAMPVRPEPIEVPGWLARFRRD